MSAVQGRRRLNLLLVILLCGVLLTGLGCPRPGVGVQPQGWAGPVVADGILYFVCGEGVLVALRIDGRVKLWQFSPENENRMVVHGTPIVSEGRLFVGAYSGNVYALDAHTGYKEWYFTTGGPIVGSPAIFGNTLIVGSSDGKLYALDARNGDPLWHEPFDSGGAIWSTPVISGTKVFFGNLDHELYAVDIETGMIMWRERFAGAVASTVLIVGRTLYIGAFDSIFYAFDAITGDRMWEFIPFEAGNWFWTRPLYYERTIFVGSLDHHIYALDARTGLQDWARPKRTGGKIRSAPVIVDGVLIVASYDGKVYGLDPRTGEERWSPIDIGVPILAHPWVEGNIVYLIDQQNTLHAIEAGISSIVWPIITEPREEP